MDLGLYRPPPYLREVPQRPRPVVSLAVDGAYPHMVSCPLCGDRVYDTSLPTHLDGVHGVAPQRRG